MNKKKLILPMYITMIALGVASVSMSIAWYAASRTLYINSIDISIDTDRELLISESIDGEYTDHISHTEREANGVFLPVTSAHSSAWLSQYEDMPKFYDESKFTEADTDVVYSEANKGFFCQKFYLKSDDDVFVTLDSKKTRIDPNTDYNPGYAEDLHKQYQIFQDEYYKDFTVEELNEMLDKVVKAMRYSILIKDGDEYSYTIIDPDRENRVVTAFGGLLDNDVDQCYDFYKKTGSEDYYERLYGEIIGDKDDYVYLDPLETDSGFEHPDNLPSAFNAKHKAGIKRLNLPKTLEKVEIKKEEAINIRDFDDATPFHFPVYRDKPKEVVVSIYIEGWDLDSVNYTMGASFISDLSFKIEREK